MKLIIALSLFVFLCSPVLPAQRDARELPHSLRTRLNGRFPGWKFNDVSSDVKQFFKQELKGESPVVVNGDFDGNRQRDYAVLMQHGFDVDNQSKTSWPRLYLIVFLRRAVGYRMYVIKEPNGEYIGLAKKGTRDYNYDKQKFITYANDSIFTGIFEKGGSSYVYRKGKFYSFVSSD